MDNSLVQTTAGVVFAAFGAFAVVCARGVRQLFVVLKSYYAFQQHTKGRVSEMLIAIMEDKGGETRVTGNCAKGSLTSE